MSLLAQPALEARAEFYLMLARAFLPPVAPGCHAAFVTDFPVELGEIALAAGYAIPDEIAAYVAAAGQVPDQTALLQGYSALFLMPPREVQLHASVYLDGSVLGRSADALERFYAQHALGQSDDFHDLPDHLAAVLEFLALLYARAADTDGYERAELVHDATELNRHFLLSWVPAMRRQLLKALRECEERETVANGVPLFAALAHILESALVADAGPLSPELRRVLLPQPQVDTHQPENRDMACCTQCGAEIAPAARVRRVRKVLEKEGIDTAHLDHCPRCRGVDLLPPGVHAPLV